MAWLHLPHVARWWAQDTTPEQEVATYRQRIAETSARPTTLLLVASAGAAVGWGQWYGSSDFPAEAAVVGATTMASRLVLEKNHFVLQDDCPAATEPSDRWSSTG